MKREDILAMSAGREMDALVAKVIFLDSKDIFVPTWSDKDWPYQWNADGNEITWKPSTDISAAWEVVEKMRSQNVYLSIQTHHNGYATEISTVDGEETYSIFDTVPEGICKVALLAVLEEDKPNEQGT